MVISDSFFSGCARWWLWVSGGDGDIGGGGGGGDKEDTGGRKLAPSGNGLLEYKKKMKRKNK